MRKVLFIFLVVLLVGTVFCIVGCGGAKAGPLPGDVNGDGEVDILDYDLLEGAFGSVPGDVNWDAGCDLNGDGAVTGLDYAVLWNYYIGPKPLLGDVNGDGRVDNTDYDLLLVAYGSIFGDSNWSIACDLNKDGTVNGADYSIMWSNWSG